MGLGFVGLIVGAFLLFGALASNARSQDRRRLELWREVAEARGGALIEGSSLGQTPGIEVEEGEVCLFMDTLVRRRGPAGRGHQGTSTSTRVRAALLVPAGLEFRVAPEGTFTKLGRSLGLRDVELGTRDFDEAFSIGADDVESVREMWSEEARGLMVDFFRGERCRCDGDVVELTVRGALKDREKIEAALDLVAELAKVDFFGVEAIEGLPGATYSPPEGPWDDRTLPSVVFDALVPVTLGPDSFEGWPVTVASVKEVSGYEDLRVRVGEGAPLPEEVRRRLPEAALSVIGQVGPAELRVEGGGAELWWDEVETSRERLLAGVHLVAAFGVGPRQGAYR